MGVSTWRNVVTFLPCCVHYVNYHFPAEVPEYNIERQNLSVKIPFVLWLKRLLLCYLSSPLHWFQFLLLVLRLKTQRLLFSNVILWDPLFQEKVRSIKDTFTDQRRHFIPVPISRVDFSKTKLSLIPNQSDDQWYREEWFFTPTRPVPKKQWPYFVSTTMILFNRTSLI